MSKIFLILIIFFGSTTLWAGIGNIMAFKGHVDVLRDTEKISAKMGMEIKQKDKILTQKSSRIQIMLKDKTVITVGSNSEFSFDEYFFDGTKNSKIKMSATKGFFRSLTGKIGKIAHKNFKLKTKSATIGIRGTDFWGEIGIKKEIIACINGAISVEVNNDTFNIDAGSLIVVEPKKVEIKKIEIKKSIKTAKSTKKNKNIKSQQKIKNAITVKEKNSINTDKVDINTQDNLNEIEFSNENIDIIEDSADLIQQDNINDKPEQEQEPEPEQPSTLPTPTIQTQDREVEY